MASNAKRIMKRLIVFRDGKPTYDFGVYTATGYGDRQLTAVVEADRFADAVGILSAPRTESGHSFKGFKKLKATS